MRKDQISELHEATVNSFITDVTIGYERYRVAPLTFGITMNKKLVLEAHVFYKGNNGKVAPLIFNSDADIVVFDCSDISYVNCNLDRPVSFKHEIVGIRQPVSSFSTIPIESVSTD